MIMYSNRKPKRDTSFKNSGLVELNWEILILKTLSRDGRNQDSFRIDAQSRNQYFEEMLSTYRVKLDKLARSRYCEEFAKLEMKSDTINNSDIEYLLQQLGVTVDSEELQAIIREHVFKSSGNLMEEQEESVPFKMFVKVVC